MSVATRTARRLAERFPRIKAATRAAGDVTRMALFDPGVSF